MDSVLLCIVGYDCKLAVLGIVVVVADIEAVVGIGAQLELLGSFVVGYKLEQLDGILVCYQQILGHCNEDRIGHHRNHC